jgi:uncharacterized membrane protein YdbT with pleckstrin-like domain
MSYIQANLLKNEKVVDLTRMHWIVFTLPVVLLVATFLLASVSPVLFRGYVPFLHIRMAAVVILLCLFATLFSAISALIRYATSEYGITNKRIMLKTGWINTNSLELFIDKIEAIYVDQTILGRILNYGTLRIVGTGGTQDPFPFVPSPLAFRKMALEQVDEGLNPRTRPK